MKKRLIILLIMAQFFCFGGCEKKEEASKKVTKFQWIGNGDLFIFQGDGEFYWYESSENLEDNYYHGTYIVYNGEKAIEYLDKEQGFSRKDQEEKIASYQGVGVERYYCIILNAKMLILDGEAQSSFQHMMIYYGFHFEKENLLFLFNLSTGDLFKYSVYK